VVRGAARQPAIAWSVNQIVRLPRWRRGCIVGCRVGDPVLLPRDAVTAVLVQLEGQWHVQSSAEEQTSYPDPPGKASDRLHATRSGATEVDVAVHALNRMVELGRLNYVRTA